MFSVSYGGLTAGQLAGAERVFVPALGSRDLEDMVKRRHSRYAAWGMPNCCKRYEIINGAKVLVEQQSLTSPCPEGWETVVTAPGDECPFWALPGPTVGTPQPVELSRRSRKRVGTMAGWAAGGAVGTLGATFAAFLGAHGIHVDAAAVGAAVGAGGGLVGQSISLKFDAPSVGSDNRSAFLFSLFFSLLFSVTFGLMSAGLQSDSGSVFRVTVGIAFLSGLLPPLLGGVLNNLFESASADMGSPDDASGAADTGRPDDAPVAG
jgi:hypothetical protein